MEFISMNSSKNQGNFDLQKPSESIVDQEAIVVEDTKNDKLKLFISYSHQNKEQKDHFVKCLEKLQQTVYKDKISIEWWCDQEIRAGKEFNKDIDDNLKNSDIVCLLISANFNDSESCQKEKDVALSLRQDKQISVVPIILSQCSWKKDEDLSKLLASTKDGKEIDSYDSPQKGWENVSHSLKKVIDSEIQFKKLKVKKDFVKELESADMLTSAHSKKEISIDDIFISPELLCYDDMREHEGDISFEELLQNLDEYPAILIAGEGQSGKTTLCRKIFLHLREQNLIPVYLLDKENSLKGLLKNRIEDALIKQYDIPSDSLKEEILKEPRSRIVPIVDNFHLANDREKHVEYLSSYKRKIIIVDDIHELNIQDKKLLASYTHFKIKECPPSLRNKLMKKWLRINNSSNSENEKYDKIDQATEQVNAILGKAFGGGIMPAYPFYILSVVSLWSMSSLEIKITSQGYCYQALIYCFLRKKGVEDKDMDTYMNFLTELAYALFSEDQKELSKQEFLEFIKKYREEYNLPIKKEILLNKLEDIISEKFGNYYFGYPYIYYFFVAKYLAEHIHTGDKNTSIDAISTIMKSLHRDENAYIAIFLSHHSKDPKIVDEIISVAQSLFKDFKQATLDKKEVGFFDEQIEQHVRKPSLPQPNQTAEHARAEQLKEEDREEKTKKIRQTEKENEGATNESEEENNEMVRQIRSSIRTVEVMGCIIKNCAGSLPKEDLDKIFQQAKEVYLRFLSSFINLIASKSDQEMIVELIAERLGKAFKDKSLVSEDQIKNMAKHLFWNINVGITYGIVTKIIHSLGSDRLIRVIEKNCDKQGTPADSLIKHGIIMQYTKNIQFKKIEKEEQKQNFSELAKRISKYQIVRYCTYHHMKETERMKIASHLKIKPKVLQQKGFGYGGPLKNQNSE